MRRRGVFFTWRQGRGLHASSNHIDCPSREKRRANFDWRPSCVISAMICAGVSAMGCCSCEGRFEGGAASDLRTASCDRVALTRNRFLDVIGQEMLRSLRWPLPCPTLFSPTPVVAQHNPGVRRIPPPITRHDVPLPCVDRRACAPSRRRQISRRIGTTKRRAEFSVRR